jgi:hypothetical protein
MLRVPPVDAQDDGQHVVRDQALGLHPATSTPRPR